ncbi:MAG: hypothetical protein DRQ55_05660 [Planctomycetota bacterium]|nr:MAG: hypothetical protein DRQ55_05660 [Planctomycetota bacterium]
MKTNLPRRAAPASQRTPGFVLVSVLIAVSVIMSFVASFGRHVVVDGRWSHASAFLLQSQETCHAGLSAARQALVSGLGLVSGPLAAGDGSADVLVHSSSDTLQQFDLSALGDDGLGVRQVLELAYQPVAASTPESSEQLPELAPASLSALLSNPDVEQIDLHGYQRLEHSVLTGVFVLYPNTVLELDDVVIQGALVTASALGGPSLTAFDAATAPTVLLDGNVRIDALSALDNLAVLMPDGVISSTSQDARLSLHGDIVAHTVELGFAGVLDGNVVSVEPAVISPLLDRVGRERKPRSWSQDLDLGGVLQPVSLAFVPQVWSLQQLAPIITYWE